MLSYLLVYYLLWTSVEPKHKVWKDIRERIWKFSTYAGLQIYGGPGSLSHDFKKWPITFQGSGPSGPILLSCEKISL